MENPIIYNAVPVWEKAPAAMDVLKENLLVLIQDMQERKVKDGTVILPRTEKEMAGRIEAAAREAGICVSCILADADSGMVYQDSSALACAARGEKALPCALADGAQGAFPVVQVANLVKEGKVYIELPGGEIRTGAASQSVSGLLNQVCPGMEVKAVYFAYPRAKILVSDELDAWVLENGAYLKVIGPAQCMLEEILAVSAQYRVETCGKCVFGHEGSAQIQMVFNDIAMKKGKASDLDLLRELCQVMRTQTLCGIGKSLAELVLDVLEKFGGEILEHITKKNCLAGVCRKFMTYHILPEKCTGCNACADSCGEEAILGRRRFIHVIDQDECIQCGACVEACEEGAIVRAGSVKPRCPKKPIPCRNR